VLSIITLPIRLLLLPFQIFRVIASLQFSTVLGILAGAGTAFAAARYLLTSEENIAALPDLLQGSANAVRTALLDWQGHVTDAQRAYSEGVADGKRDLQQHYLSRSGRDSN
jgi:hypothetical protein